MVYVIETGLLDSMWHGVQRLAAEPPMASEQEKPAKANAQKILPSLQRLPAAEPAMASGQEKPAKANAQQTLPSLGRPSIT